MNMDIKRILQAVKPNDAEQQNNLGTEIIFGLIESISPLKIKIEQGWTLDDDNVVISHLLKTVYVWNPVFYTEEKKHSHYLPEIETSTSNGHTHTIPITPVKKIMGIDGHIHNLTDILTLAENGHMHQIKAEDKTGKCEKFELFMSQPFYATNYYNLQHFHKLENIKLTTQPAADGHTHEILYNDKTFQTLAPTVLWRPLKVGDTVNIIKMSGNQMYYVIERQGMGVIN